MEPEQPLSETAQFFAQMRLLYPNGFPHPPRRPEVGNAVRIVGLPEYENCTGVITDERSTGFDVRLNEKWDWSRLWNAETEEYDDPDTDDYYYAEREQTFRESNLEVIK